MAPTTIPSVEELQLSILQVIQQLYSLKDDQGGTDERKRRSFPCHGANENVACGQGGNGGSGHHHGQTNIVQVMDEVTLSVAQNPRLPWTDKFAVFRTDGSVKPLIRQEEEAVMLKAIAEGSELEFEEDKAPLRCRYMAQRWVMASGSKPAWHSWCKEGLMTTRYKVTGVKVRFGPGFVLELEKSQADARALIFFITRKAIFMLFWIRWSLNKARSSALMKAIFPNHGGIRWKKSPEKKPKAAASPPAENGYTIKHRHFGK